MLYPYTGTSDPSAIGLSGAGLPSSYYQSLANNQLQNNMAMQFSLQNQELQMQVKKQKLDEAIVNRQKYEQQLKADLQIKFI